MTKPAYPSEILCSSRYKRHIASDDIMAACPEAVVGHWLDGERSKFIDDSMGDGYEQLRMSALPIDRMANLSTSLLGGLFLLSHFHYTQKNKDQWDGEGDVDESLASADNYDWMEVVTIVGWMIADIHLQPLAYSRLFGKKKDYDEYKGRLAKSIEDSKDKICLEEWENLASDEQNAKMRIVNLEGLSMVNHDPKPLNYWHFVIDIYPAEDKRKPLPSGVSKSWKGKLAVSLQDILRNTFIDMKDGYQPPVLISKTVWVK